MERSFVRDVDGVPVDTVLPPALAFEVGVAAAVFDAPVVRMMGWVGPVAHLDAEGAAATTAPVRQPGQWSVINGLPDYGPDDHARDERRKEEEWGRRGK